VQAWLERAAGQQEDGGGFVSDAIHSVQANTPIENVAAMFKALDDARGI